MKTAAALLVAALALFTAPCGVYCRPVSSVLGSWPWEGLLPSFQDFKAPDFCHDTDCPTFTNMTKGSKPYEVRKYDPGRKLARQSNTPTWVGTNVTSFRFELAITKAVAKLVAYLKGANEDGRSISMTTPVVTTFHPQSDFKHVSHNFTSAIFLPYEYQTHQQVSTDEPKRPPKPSSDAVFLFETPEGVAYVRSFGGFALEDDVLKEAHVLDRQLKKDKVSFVEDTFLFATYDPPTRLKHRHNEVWFMSKPSTE